MPRRALVLLFFAAAGCGGKVVVDAVGAGGGGGAGSSTSSGIGGEVGSSAASGTGGSVASSSSSSASSSSSSSGTGGADAVLCEQFCGVIPPSCPSGDACTGACLGLLASGCAQKAKAFLACVPPWLQQMDCLISYPDPWSGCAEPVNALIECLEQNAVSLCSSFGATLEPDHTCTGEASCQGSTYNVTCDLKGDCTCTKNGANVGVCQNLVNGAELCKPFTSCCRAFFSVP